MSRNGPKTNKNRTEIFSPVSFCDPNAGCVTLNCYATFVGIGYVKKNSIESSKIQSGARLYSPIQQQIKRHLLTFRLKNPIQFTNKGFKLAGFSSVFLTLFVNSDIAKQKKQMFYKPQESLFFVTCCHAQNGMLSHFCDICSILPFFVTNL